MLCQRLLVALHKNLMIWEMRRIESARALMNLKGLPTRQNCRVQIWRRQQVRLKILRGESVKLRKAQGGLLRFLMSLESACKAPMARCAMPRI